MIKSNKELQQENDKLRLFIENLNEIIGDFKGCGKGYNLILGDKSDASEIYEMLHHMTFNEIHDFITDTYDIIAFLINEFYYYNKRNNK